MSAAGHHPRGGKMLRACLAVFVVAFGPQLPGQTSGAQQLRVLSDSVSPVPYAVVSVGGGVERIADAKGEVAISLPRSGALTLRVRRIGYREFRGAPSTDSSGLFVRLQPLAVQLDAVVSLAKESSPLSRTGFYDRLDRVQRGAIVGEFVTPEQLDDRAAANTSDYLRGLRYVRIGRIANGTRNSPLVLGRGNCGMTVIVDGQRVSNMVEENLGGEAPTSISGRGTAQRQSDNTLDIDQAVNGKSIMAIEVYPSTANAPAELQTLGGRGSCGIVAIWTGPRR